MMNSNIQDTTDLNL